MTDRTELERQIAGGAETVVVTQADSEAAADFRWLWNRDLATETDLAEAFARHRIATQADALAVMREAEGALGHVCDALEGEIAEYEGLDEVGLVNWLGEEMGRRIIAARMRLETARTTLANLRAVIARMGVA